MATKEDLGTRKKCFTCKNIMVCKQTEHNGEVKYQWQNDDGTAHYGFNQETNKPFCKNTSQEESTTTPSAVGDQPHNPVEHMKDPTPEEFQKLGISLLNPLEINDISSHTNKLIEETTRKIAEVLIKRSVIEQVMNDLGLKHPGRVAFTDEVLRG